MSNLTSKSIVTATVTALLNRTAAGANVFPWKTTPVQTESLPCLVVSATRASEDSRSETHPIYGITTTLTVEAHLKATEDAAWSSDVDTVCDRIKRALLCDPTWLAQEFRGVSKVETTIGQNVEGDYRRIVALVEFSLEHDAKYEPLADETLDLQTLHYTDEATPPIEAEFLITPEEVGP